MSDVVKETLHVCGCKPHNENIKKYKHEGVFRKTLKVSAELNPGVSSSTGSTTLYGSEWKKKDGSIASIFYVEIADCNGKVTLHPDTKSGETSGDLACKVMTLQKCLDMYLAELVHMGLLAYPGEVDDPRNT